MTEVYLWVGAIVCNAVLLAAYLVAGMLGKQVWKRVTRVYHLTVIAYWLDRLEREGTHVFEKAKEQT